jgi:hypothetical protein
MAVVAATWARAAGSPGARVWQRLAEGVAGARVGVGIWQWLCHAAVLRSRQGKSGPVRYQFGGDCGGCSCAATVCATGASLPLWKGFCRTAGQQQRRWQQAGGPAFWATFVLGGSLGKSLSDNDACGRRFPYWGRRVPLQHCP